MPDPHRTPAVPVQGGVIPREEQRSTMSTIRAINITRLPELVSAVDAKLKKTHNKDVEVIETA